ncbi:MAG: hypothetical protein GTN62_00425, partial [Gemmatimonadales bacterium]|nr:hypothetical protein [Gemmatimonadales bacterium]NIN48573.1 hypothetical protein [Gemmatimonadales bacterium]NIP06037.1 hypothetical protein [Gemmatimonadales bacterium]NIR01192.1 hypothetical protein [Gemmatimonadales bacterium]
MSPESALRFRVLLTDDVLPEGLQILRGCAALEVDLRAGISAAELKSIIGDYDALIV